MSKMELLVELKCRVLKISATDGFNGNCDAPNTYNVNITVEDLEF